MMTNPKCSFPLDAPENLNNMSECLAIQDTQYGPPKANHPLLASIGVPLGDMLMP